jgi:glycosyltransferase involved in cell wall biosynthesis
VIIPTQGHLKKLQRLLKSLETVHGLEDSEILLVLNPASSILDSLPQEFPNLPLRVLTSSTGVNHARNAGLEKAQGDLVFFLDDDCWILSKDFFNEHTRAHTQNPWVLAVGGFYQNENPSELCQAYADIQKEWLESNLLHASGECTTLLGGHFSLKRSLLKEARFDASIIYGGAETEFFFRLRQQGHRYLLIPLAVGHDPHLHIFSFLRKAYLQGRTHRRLVTNRMLSRGPWIHQLSRKPTIYRKLYRRFFHSDFSVSFFSNCRASFMSSLKRLHQDICFYLSNKNRF